MNLWYCRQETAERLRSCIVRLDVTESRIDQHVEERILAIARADYPFDPDPPIEIWAIEGVIKTNGGSWPLEDLVLKDGHS